MIRNLLLGFILLNILNSNAQTPESPLKIVCMGNSITQGKVVDGKITEKSYRPWLWEKLDSAGVAIDMVGYLNTFFTESATNLVATPTSRYTGKTFDRDHDSYYGIRSGGLLNGDASDGGKGWTGLPLPKLSDRLKNYTPDIALLHIGTNDPDGEVDITESNIKAIIDELRVKNPRVVVFVAKLISFWKPINGRVDQIVAAKSTATSPVIAVDLATGFIADRNSPNTMTFDGLHPNEKGQKFMSDRWYAAIMKHYNITSTSNEVEASNTVRIYPTMSKGNLTLENCSDSEISIYNINGSVVSAFVTKSSTIENIDLADLTNGMYFLKINKEGKITTKTFLIEK